MEVGHRKSRQRRHLPTHATTLQQQHQKSSISTSSSSSQKEQDGGSTSSDDDNYHHSSQQQRGRGRKLLAKKRMQQHFGHLVTSSKKGAMTNESVRRSVHWRVWFWRFCILWLVFLTMRVLTSIWQGDATQLGLNQYLSQISSTCWWHRGD